MSGAKTALNDHDARLRFLFQETGMGITLVDLQRRILDVNPAFERMLGYKKSELVGQTFAAILYPEDSPLNLKLHEEMLAGMRDVYHMERRYIRKDGSLLWTRLTVSLLRDDKGKPQITMGVVEDITDTKAAEAKLAENQRLLVQAAKMSAIGEMAGGIAHEIGNPLTVIRYRIEQLRQLVPKLEGEIAKAFNECADSIDKTTTHIFKIVKGLRALARKGDAESYQMTSIKSLLDDTLELCIDKFKYQGIKLKVTGATADLKVECRPTQILQVLVNLLNNAHDAIQTLKDKWVHIEVCDFDDSVEIWVTDSGNGIPQAVTEKLFQSGFTTKPVGKGTGLGLSISKSILESHRGSLQIDSQSPHTRFVIRLPKHQNQSAKAA